jgi:hypothetical protein
MSDIMLSEEHDRVIRRLMAENKRLRAALQKIADHASHGEFASRDKRAIAIAALANQQQTKPD